MSSNVIPFWLGLGLAGTLLLAVPLVFLGAFHVLGQWTGAATEDRRWKEARLEIGERAHELVAFDTRLIRPWGPSAAVEQFVMKARAVGEGWVEGALDSFHEHSPTLIRGVVGEVEETRVAFVVASTRKSGLFAKRLALGAAGVIEEIAPSGRAPAEAFVRDLEALARSARIPELGNRPSDG